MDNQEFKDLLLKTLIEALGSNRSLLINGLESSNSIVLSVESLKKLLSVLLHIPYSSIKINLGVTPSCGPCKKPFSPVDSIQITDDNKTTKLLTDYPAELGILLAHRVSLDFSYESIVI
jgi:hypothetical protein